MEPFFSGMAIGLAILIPLVLLIFAVRILWLLIAGCVIAIRETRKGPSVAGLERQRQAQLRAEGAQADAAAWRAWLEEAKRRRRERNERQLAWMDRHWPIAWYARLYRRIFRYPPPATAK